jgi:hypothetical protein
MFHLSGETLKKIWDEEIKLKVEFMITYFDEYDKEYILQEYLLYDPRTHLSFFSPAWKPLPKKETRDSKNEIVN